MKERYFDPDVNFFYFYGNIDTITVSGNGSFTPDPWDNIDDDADFD